MKKQPEITEATRKDFIYAFCEYYKERPIDKITVKEISEKAGYSRVTFYNYFKDPYDLLNQIEEEFVSNLTTAISDNIEQDKVLDNLETERFCRRDYGSRELLCSKKRDKPQYFDSLCGWQLRTLLVKVCIWLCIFVAGWHNLCGERQRL